MDEEEERRLPDVLKKLEIVPLPLSASNPKQPGTLNPFFLIQPNIVTSSCCSLSSHSAQSPNELDIEQIGKLFGTKCSCNKQVEPQTTNSSTNSAANLTDGHSKLDHEIQNLASFKPKKNITRRSNRLRQQTLLVRAPVLKILQNCIHHSHLRHKKHENLSSSDGMPECLTLDALNLEKSKLNNDIGIARNTNSNRLADFGSENCDLLLDFKALITECDIISNNNGLRRRNSNFTTIQSCNPRRLNATASESDVGFNNRKVQTTSRGVSEETDNEEQTMIAGVSAAAAAAAQFNGNGASCSQQARFNAPTSSTAAATSSDCDVTIDELASYFETFVYIPKKMSEMAEMMYI